MESMGKKPHKRRSVYPFIEAEQAQQHRVQRACRLLQVPRAACYAHRAGPSARDRAGEVLAMRIRAAHAESKGRYGAPRVHAEPARRGHRHGRKRIARLMTGEQDCDIGCDPVHDASAHARYLG